MNSSTGSVINHHNSIDYTNKRDEISTNRCWRENSGLSYGIDIGDILPASEPNQYFNME